MNRWLIDNGKAIMDSLNRTKDRPTQFIVLIVLLGILLAIPGWLAQIWLGMQSLVPDDAVYSEAVVFLADDIDIETRIELERFLQDQTITQSITFVSKHDALIQLSRADGLADIGKLIDHNPLPDALRVRFDLYGASAAEEDIISVLQSDRRVQGLKYYPSTRVQYAALVETLGLIGIAFGALTIGGVLMAVFLVSAADVVDDRRRIELYTLLGASRGFIKRPYIYRALLIGLFSGLFACVVVIGINELLSKVLTKNLQTLNSGLGEMPIDNQILLGLGVVAILTSLIGAERAVNRRLNSLH